MMTPMSMSRPRRLRCSPCRLSRYCSTVIGGWMPRGGGGCGSSPHWTVCSGGPPPPVRPTTSVRASVTAVAELPVATAAQGRSRGERAGRDLDLLGVLVDAGRLVVHRVRAGGRR